MLMGFVLHLRLFSWAWIATLHFPTSLSLELMKSKHLLIITCCVESDSNSYKKQCWSVICSLSSFLGGEKNSVSVTISICYVYEVFISRSYEYEVKNEWRYYWCWFTSHFHSVNLHLIPTVLVPALTWSSLLPSNLHIQFNCIQLELIVE